MRILVLNDGWPPSQHGGAEIVAAGLASKYAAAGHDVAILTTERRGQRPFYIDAADQGIPKYVVPAAYHKLLRPYLSLRSPRVEAAVASVLEQFQPHVAHAHNVHRYLTYGALTTCRRYGTPVVLTFHDAMSVDYGRFVQAYRHRPKREADIGDFRVRQLPLIAKYHVQYFPLRGALIRRLVETSVNYRCAPSADLYRLLEANGIACDEVVPNGIDPSIAEPLSEAGSDPAVAADSPHTSTLALSGRLTRDKGCFQALQAVARLVRCGVDVKLLVIGASRGEYRPFDRAVTAAAMAERVIYTGWLPRADVLRAYKACTAVLVPSICLDVFPTVVLEAMACAKPVIATCFGGAKDVVEHGKTGFVVSPFDEEGFAAAIRRLVDEPGLAAEMGGAGRTRLENKFHIDRPVARYLEIFAELRH